MFHVCIKIGRQMNISKPKTLNDCAKTSSQ